jgi:glycosyltransferase involved in cell wall biosynthesis
MRVIHVIPSIDRQAGGPTTALLGLAAAQVKAGSQVSVLTTFRAIEDRAMAQLFGEQGIKVEMIGPVQGKLGWHPDMAFLAAELVGRGHIVHIHAVWENLLHYAARAARRKKIPYVIRPCGMLDPWSLAQHSLVKKALLAWRVRSNLKRAAALHFTSATERDLTNPLKLKARAIVEPNGIDLGEFDQLPPAGTFAARYPQLQGRPFLLFLSRLHPKKGLDLLIPAFAKIAAEAAMANVMLVLAGPDSDGYLAELQKMIERHQLADRVLLPGMLTGQDRIAALAEARLFVLPSYQENFGIAVVEALAASTPVIISDQVNIHAEISAAGVGDVVPTQIDALAAAMLQWMRNAEQRAQAARVARDFVRDHYDWMQIATHWRRHYEEILTR